MTESAVSGQAIPLFSWRSAGREFKIYLPAWFIYLEAVGLMYASLANFPDDGFAALGIPRILFAPTVLFPLAWMGAFFALRIRESQRLPSPWKAWLGIGGLLVAVPAAAVLFHRPHPLSHDQLTLLFEASQFIWVGILAVHVAWARGRHAVVLFFGITFLFGLVLENTGIIIGYFHEPSFRLYLGPFPAPLCTMVGWCVVFYVTMAVTQQIACWIPWLGRSVWRRALTATLLALSLDAQLDPLASMSGVFWRWNELLPPAFLGVPLLNYAAWFGAFLPYTWFVFKFLDRDDLSGGQKNWELFLRIPLAALLGGILCFGVMAVFERGLDGPTFAILREFIERLRPY